MGNARAQKAAPLRLLKEEEEENVTLRSGMLNLLLVERLLVRVVAVISLSHVCWQVFSPGAEINQNSVMAAEEREMESLKQKDIHIQTLSRHSNEYRINQFNNTFINKSLNDDHIFSVMHICTCPAIIFTSATTKIHNNIIHLRCF